MKLIWLCDPTSVLILRGIKIQGSLRPGMGLHYGSNLDDSSQPKGIYAAFISTRRSDLWRDSHPTYKLGIHMENKLPFVVSTWIDLNIKTRINIGVFIYYLNAAAYTPPSRKMQSFFFLWASIFPELRWTQCCLRSEMYVQFGNSEYRDEMNTALQRTKLLHNVLIESAWCLFSVQRALLGRKKRKSSRKVS